MLPLVAKQSKDAISAHSKVAVTAPTTRKTSVGIDAHTRERSRMLARSVPRPSLARTSSNNTFACTKGWSLTAAHTVSRSMMISQVDALWLWTLIKELNELNKLYSSPVIYWVVEGSLSQNPLSFKVEFLSLTGFHYFEGVLILSVIILGWT